MPKPGPTRLPERLAGQHGLLLRRWSVADAVELAHVVAESAEHLRPWMSWVASEPLPLADREARLRDWEHDWSQGGDVMLGIFRGGLPVGSCSLHRRIAPDGLEIGYWLHPSFTHQGLATSAVCLLTDAAFTVVGISHLEIHHDKANIASGGIPRRLGYRLVTERPDAIAAPADIGIECVWRIDRDRWMQRGLRPRDNEPPVR